MYLKENVYFIKGSVHKVKIMKVFIGLGFYVFQNLHQGKLQRLFIVAFFLIDDCSKWKGETRASVNLKKQIIYIYNIL